MIPLSNTNPEPFRLVLPDGSILLHHEQTIQAIKAVAVALLTCPCLESDLAIIDENGKVVDDTQMPIRQVHVVIRSHLNYHYPQEHSMTNKQSVTLQDGHGRTITATVQSVEELKTIATEMVSRRGQQVVDLFMLDEVGNRVTNEQKPPEFVRIVSTLRTI